MHETVFKILILPSDFNFLFDFIGFSECSYTTHIWLNLYASFCFGNRLTCDNCTTVMFRCFIWTAFIHYKHILNTRTKCRGNVLDKLNCNVEFRLFRKSLEIEWREPIRTQPPQSVPVYFFRRVPATIRMQLRGQSINNYVGLQFVGK